jgi:serine protease Do
MIKKNSSSKINYIFYITILCIFLIICNCYFIAKIFFNKDLKEIINQEHTSCNENLNIQTNEESKKNSPETWADITNTISPAVVQIFTFSSLFDWMEPYRSPEQRMTCGTAFFINENGYMITNGHCVDQSEVMYIQIPQCGKNRFKVELVAVAHDRDLALIRLTQDALREVKEKIKQITYLQFDDSDLIERAEEVLAVGFPLGQEWIKTTTGVVSGIQMLGSNHYIQISAPINPGNSGGPALNKHGKVVGVNTCVIQGGMQNIGYVIPSRDVTIFLNYLKNFHNELLIHSSKITQPELVRYPMLGIVYHGSPEPLIKYLKNPLPGGVYIADVIKDSLADKAGLKKQDMIYAINGYAVDRYGELKVPWCKDVISLVSYLSHLDLGDTLTFIVYRKGKKETIKTTWKLLEPRPIRYLYPDHDDVPYIIIGGIVLMPLSLNHIQLMNQRIPDLLEFSKIKKQISGKVLVSHVLPNSVGERARFMHAGMIVTHINDIYVSTIEECKNALYESKKTGYLTLKTETDEFFVAQVSDIIKDEVYLSQMYQYPQSSFIADLQS